MLIYPKNYSMLPLCRNTRLLLIVPVSAMRNTMSQSPRMLNASQAFVLANVAGVAMELVFDLL